MEVKQETVPTHNANGKILS